jgi:hypothetical protein
MDNFSDSDSISEKECHLVSAESAKQRVIGARQRASLARVNG